MRCPLAALVVIAYVVVVANCQKPIANCHAYQVSYVDGA